MLQLVIASTKTDIESLELENNNQVSKQNILDSLDECEMYRDSNIYIKKYLFLEENHIIKAGCFLDAVKDMKICSLNIFTTNKDQNQNLLTEILKCASTYALETLMMETICFMALKDDKLSMRAALENKFLMDDLENNYTSMVYYIKDRTFNNVKNQIR